MKFAVVTPTYNEVGNIERLLSSLQQVSKRHKTDTFQIFVIDDSSPDGTADLVTHLASQLHSNNFSISLFTRIKKDGLGKAYIYGFDQILRSEESFDYVIQMDADLSHDPNYITSFIHQANNKADFVVASRYISGGGTPDWPLFKKFLSRGGNLYTRIFLGSRITDYTGGFNMYETGLLRRMDTQTIEAHGYGFLIELKHRALASAAHVVEVPIVFVDRKNGSSKIPKTTIFNNFALVLKIRYEKKK